MIDPVQLHREQFDYWNGPGGEHWVAQQRHTDVMLGPVTEALLAHDPVRPGERVLDIGCGCGATTLALAGLVGPEGRVVGLDISAPMLAVARRRAAGLPTIEFIEADAGIHSFARGDFDRVFSRFGVMFFGDPVAAFAQLRAATAPSGRLVFACWRPPAENPWMMVPLQAAYEHVPPLPRPGPEEPGPFSFGDPARVDRILTGAGWRNPRLIPVDLELDVAAGDGLEGAVQQVMQIGATSRALHDQPDRVRAAVAESIRGVLAPFVRGDQVMLGGAIWLVTAEPA